MPEPNPAALLAHIHGFCAVNKVAPITVVNLFERLVSLAETSPQLGDAWAQRGYGICADVREWLKRLETDDDD